MKKKIKVLLSDPRHNTRGLHSSYVPINIGYIGSFLKKELIDLDLDLVLATEPNEIDSENNIQSAYRVHGYWDADLC